ncbi:hypothetical protein Pmani_007285, partial [Petrolisthes manimaculis]
RERTKGDSLVTLVVWWTLELEVVVLLGNYRSQLVERVYQWRLLRRGTNWIGDGVAGEIP